jgi:hypothetical protein
LDESIHVGFKSTNGAQMQGTLKHGNDILLFHSKKPESQPFNQKGESSVKKLVTNETSDEKLKLIFETSTIFENIQKNNECSTNAKFYRVFLTEYQNSFDKNDNNFSVAHFQKMLFHLVECVSYNDSHLLTKVFSFLFKFSDDGMVPTSLHSKLKRISKKFRNRKLQSRLLELLVSFAFTRKN